MAKPKGGRRRKFPFRFEKMWLTHPSLLNYVKEWWNVQVEGTAMFHIAKKLRIVKDKVRKWIKETFGDIFLMKVALQLELNII